MMSETKIVVVKRKQLIYVGVIAAILIILIVCIAIMSGSKEKDEDAFVPPETTSDAGATYKAGVYTTLISINNTVVSMEVVLDKDHINAISLVNLDESIATMYPLFKPSLASLEEQLINGVAIEDIKFSDNGKFTQQVLLDAISSVLEQASINP